MTVVEYAALIGAGLVAGALNVFAAGGAVFSFLVLGWLGLPPHIANATNLAATPASFLSMVPNYWRERRRFARHWPLLVAAVVGTIVGFKLFHLMSVDAFRKVAPVLLILATLTLIAHPVLKHRLARRPAPEMTRIPRVGMIAGIFTTSAYAGYFGGGVGVLVLIVLAVVTAWPWVVANELKNLICLVTALVGLAAYATTDLVNVPVAVVLGASMAAGGHLGKKIIDKLPRENTEDILRESVAVASAFGAGVMVATT